MTFLPCIPTVVNSIVGEVFDEPLARAHFVKADPRKYVRTRITGVRDVFMLRGDNIRLIPVWGFSFDFAPHIVGRYTETVRWHRTPKSAEPDLRYSGLPSFFGGPHPAAPGTTINTIAGEGQMRTEAIFAKQTLLSGAIAKLDSVRNFSDIRALFETEERIAKDFFFDLTQLSLAYAFYLAKAGDEQRARQYISKWLVRGSRGEETQQRIIKLFEEAAASPIIVH